MSSFGSGGNRKVLDFIAAILRNADAEFPDVTVTGFLRDIFQAEFGSAGEVDLRGSASRHWADSPHPADVDPTRFHAYAVRHPLALAYQRIGVPVPLRLSDVTSAGQAPQPCRGTRMSRLMTIPLTVAPAHICAVALMRGGADFSTDDMRLAGQLQPVLSGLYALRGRLGPSGGAEAEPGMEPDAGISLTAREVAVLDLMADGLIAAAIARQLGISPRTVDKHIQNIYRKFGIQDRTSAVLRAQAMGVLRPR